MWTQFISSPAHAENVVNVSGMVFAAAVFTGVLTGTGMVVHAEEQRRGIRPRARGGQTGHDAVTDSHFSLVSNVLTRDAQIVGAHAPAGHDRGAAMVLGGELPSHDRRANIQHQSPRVVRLDVLHACDMVLRGDVDLFNVTGVSGLVHENQRLGHLTLAY